MKLNKKDLLKAVFLPTFPTAIFIFLVLYFSNNNVDEIANSIVDFFQQFSLAIFCASITIFSLLQILQSKEWFSKVKDSKAFDNLIGSFKICIIFCILGIFLPFIFELIMFNKPRNIINSALIAGSLWTMGFICSELWSIIKTFIVTVKS